MFIERFGDVEQLQCSELKSTCLGIQSMLNKQRNKKANKEMFVECVNTATQHVSVLNREKVSSLT